MIARARSIRGIVTLNRIPARIFAFWRISWMRILWANSMMMTMRFSHLKPTTDD